MFRRYAIYVAPDGPMGAAGAAWLGWDIAKGQPVPHPKIAGMDVTALTKRPRKYGFHATIKPPMALAQDTTAADLIAAATAHAHQTAAVTLDGLRVTRIGRFLALTAVGDTDALDTLAAGFVRTLDPFRAATTQEELDRRRQRPLSPSQERNLLHWGYPHVMEDFRFHITLTGPLKEPEQTSMRVADHFAPLLGQPYTIDHLIVAGEDENGMFHTVARLPLAG